LSVAVVLHGDVIMMAILVNDAYHCKNGIEGVNVNYGDNRSYVEWLNDLWCGSVSEKGSVTR
jgi:hypothetical protein